MNTNRISPDNHLRNVSENKVSQKKHAPRKWSKRSTPITAQLIWNRLFGSTVNAENKAHLKKAC